MSDAKKILGTIKKALKLFTRMNQKVIPQSILIHFVC